MKRRPFALLDMARLTDAAGTLGCLLLVLWSITKKRPPPKRTP